MPKTSTEAKYIDRELSWLEFNQRVLDEAACLSNPPLERLRFLAITASNLDEFFMVRVGGLQQLAASHGTSADPAGLTPDEQLAQVRDWVADAKARAALPRPPPPVPQRAGLPDPRIVDAEPVEDGEEL